MRNIMRHYKIEVIQHTNLQGRVLPKLYRLQTIEGNIVFTSSDEDLVKDLEFLMESARIRRRIPANLFALQESGVSFDD